MTLLYGARGAFGLYTEEDPSSWYSYAGYDTLLDEVVTLDTSLNEDLVKPDYDNADDWLHIHIVDVVEEAFMMSQGKMVTEVLPYATGLYTTQDYVLKRAEAKDRFNFIVATINPDKDCSNINIPDYTFEGYDLMDRSFSTSSLTNCGGPHDRMVPLDANRVGLIDDYAKALEMQQWLRVNYPEDYHSKTNVVAIWRHNTIGRK